MDGFILSGRAKLTSFVSGTTTHDGLFMDDNARQILQSKCNLGDHEFYEATLYVRKEPVRFYYLGLFYDFDSLIKFPKCIYAIHGLKREEDLPSECSNMVFNNCRDVYKIEDMIPYRVNICFSKIVFDKKVKGLDLFYYGLLGLGIGVVSERFKNAVEEAGLTGIVFDPIEVEFEE